MAFIALLDGRLLAVRPTHPTATGATQQQKGTCPAPPGPTTQLVVAWTSAGPAPVFSAPCVARASGVNSRSGRGKPLAAINSSSIGGLSEQQQESVGGGVGWPGSGGRDGMELVICGHVDGCVRGLQTSDGSQVWRQQLEGQLFADLVVQAADENLGGSCLLAVTHASRLYSLAVADGVQVRTRCVVRGRVTT